jgi:hypothetical protein
MAGTPATKQCGLERAHGANVSFVSNLLFENWPKNQSFTPALRFAPTSLSELAAAILKSERAGFHVRARGATWSFSDAGIPADGVHAGQPGALIDTRSLHNDLQSKLPSILAAGVDPTYLFWVEAGISCDDLNAKLDSRAPRQTVAAGGGAGQTLAGLMSTSTHSGDSTVTPLVDYVRAIHLVGAGGIEHWIERDAPITYPAHLQAVYPCLATDNIHYDSELFNAVLVSAGSMGVIYSVILQTTHQIGLLQHRVATTWEELVGLAGRDFASVLDGSYIVNKNNQIDIFDQFNPMVGPFSPNIYTQVVLNPYPFEPNDASLSQQQNLRIGQHLCIVTNRVEVPIPVPPPPPAGIQESLDSVGQQAAQAALDALGNNPADIVKFLELNNGLAHEPDVSRKAAALIDFLADNYAPGTISAVNRFVLKKIMPVWDRTEVATRLTEVMVWHDNIRSLCFEAAFAVPDAVAFVPRVLDLVNQYAAQMPHNYIGGYLSLRFVGKPTAALLGMQRWSPTCHVEYAVLSGTRGIDAFIADLQRLALASNGILHFGMNNEVMTAADVRRAFGPANVRSFRRARAVLSEGGTFNTFDNSFTDRLELSALVDNRLDWSLISNTSGARPGDPNFADLTRAGIRLWSGRFAQSNQAQMLFNYSGDGNWWLGTLRDGDMTWNSVGNTAGFGDLADGRPFWIGQFSGSGRDEVLFHYPGDGHWFLGTYAAGQLIWNLAGDTKDFGNVADGRPFWTGRFSKPGQNDVMFYYPGDSTWWLGSFTGNTMSWSVACQTPNFGNMADGRPVWSGRFTDAVRTDMLFYSPANCDWQLGHFNGATMNWSLAGNTAGFGDLADGRPFWVGQFSGSGRDDVLFYYPGDQNWWLGTFNGANLDWALVGNTAGFGQVADGRPFWVGDFTGSGKDEILFYYPGDSNWWLGAIAGGTLGWSLVGSTAIFGDVADGRPFWVEDFKGSGRMGVLFYNPGNGGWWLGNE